MDLLRAADRELRDADRLLTIAQAVAYLAHRGRIVHPNTVRNWCKHGAGVRRSDRSLWIARRTLDHIASCPVCFHR